MSAQTDRLNTALDGRYRILRHLGEGGMATVYLCEDLKHDRQVALKLLKPELAAVLGAERFVQEIKTTAALQHPHILPLFDSGAADGFLFYVMPFIDGEALRAKLDRETQLSVDDAVRIAREVADALDYAHTRGIVHRDVKPENIMLHGGHAMVVDFGIALAVSAAAGGRMTETGLSLGTPHYMSPEQATAEKDISARSDVYSLGSVLYEMLTGNPPHVGSSAQQIIMRIITDVPRPLMEVRRSVPANIAAAVAHSLEKLPADRFDSAKAFADALANPAYTHGTPTASLTDARRPKSMNRVLAATTVLATVVAVTASVIASHAPKGGRMPPARFALVLADSVRVRADVSAQPFAISPDGSLIAYVGGGPARLFLRPLNELAPRPIQGTEGASLPQFSPDGLWLAFMQGGRVQRMPLAGGPPSLVVESASDFSWESANLVAFTRLRRSGGGLWIVNALGGTAELVWAPDSLKGEIAVSPVVTRDGKAIVFGIRTGSQAPELAVVAMADKRVTRLGIQGLDPRLLADDVLGFVTPDGAFMVAPFDARKLRVSGPGVPVLEDVLNGTTFQRASIAVSRTGTLVYQTNQARSRQLVMVGRTGVARTLPGEPRGYSQLRLSPDGRRLAVAISASATSSDVWTLDLTTGTATQVTRDGVSDRPDWTADGRRIVWHAGRTPDDEVRWQLADLSRKPERLLTNAMFAAMSPAGRVFMATMAGGSIQRFPIDSPRTGVEVARSAGQGHQRVSPDGKWFAYVSSVESAGTRSQVYVRAMSGEGDALQISTNGGAEPVWGPNGDEVVYRAGGKVISAEVTTVPHLALVRRDTLFNDAYADSRFVADYDITRDGKSFVMVKSIVEGTPNIVFGWMDEVRAQLNSVRK
ncbi:MAG: serine/threonine-protein kinase [Gemmatimonadaceae bacterium]|nr:serine/threonine-protein kinase [Gemmatimonadaceae bacterium]